MKRVLGIALALLFCLGLTPNVYAYGAAERGRKTDWADIQAQEEYPILVDEILDEAGNEAFTRTGLIANASLFYPVHFYNEKGYDLIGLVVLDSEGKTMESDDGWTFLLAPGTYTYRYHDEREIFADLADTLFTVADTALEIPLVMTAAFADSYVFSLEVNPLYVDLLDASKLEVPYDVYEETIDGMVKQRLSAGVMLRGAPTPAQQVRSNMAARVSETPFSFYTDDQWSFEDLNEKFCEIAAEAVQHTGNHFEGDTLRWIYYASGTYHPDTVAGLNIYDRDRNQYRHDFSAVFLYRTTADQEQAVCDVVENMAAGFEGMSDYQKAYAINEWLFQNVDYDYTHVGDSEYRPQFTDYAALFDRTCVCQGFSITFYRLALAAGLDARIVTSAAMGHAWNIVEIEGTWHELDSTWDSNRRQNGALASELPHFFLRGSAWWETGHRNSGGSTIGDQFFSSSSNYDPSFNSYRLSETDYDTQEQATYIILYNANNGDSAPGSQVKAHGTDLTLTTEAATRANLPEETLTLTLKGNGGTIVTTTNPAAPSATIPGKKNVRFTFLGWNKMKDGSGTSYNPGDIYTEDKNVELFAQWKRTTTVSKFTLPTPNREGYFFVGWGASSDATEGITGEYVLMENTTLYAVWVQPDFFVPAAVIEEEAFAGGAFTFVKLSENTETVGPRAFADCPNLKYACIPTGATVDETAFPENVTVFRPAANVH